MSYLKVPKTQEWSVGRSVGKLANYFRILWNKKQIHVDDICWLLISFKEILTGGKYLKFFIYKFCNILTEILVETVSGETLTLGRLFDLLKQILNQNDIRQLSCCLVPLIRNKGKPIILQQLWRRSARELADCLIMTITLNFYWNLPVELKY